jgi:hypothetical protein
MMDVGLGVGGDAPPPQLKKWAGDHAHKSKAEPINFNFILKERKAHKPESTNKL